MSASFTHPSVGVAAAPRVWRFGAEETAPGESQAGAVQWLLKRNCSSTPRQVLGFFASLCVVSLAIGVFFWVQGASLVMPFAWIEMVVVGSALLFYSRHATDSERIHLQPGRLTVEHVHGKHVERVEFATAWVRVEPEHGARSLIELSGQGRHISVGRFVRPELRRQLADELRWALRRWPFSPAARPENAWPNTDTEDKSEN